MDFLGMAEQFLTSTLAQNPAAQNGMLGAVARMVQNYPGGLSGIVQQFENTGLGQQVKSWVGTGANQPITGQQMQQALGGDVDALAQQTGLPQHSIAQSLAGLLPQLIDQLTPKGALPDDHDAVAAALQALQAQRAA